MHYFYQQKGLEMEARRINLLGFGAHLHEHLELVLLLGGSARGQVDSSVYTLSGGDAFLVFPNQVHQFDDDNEVDGLLCIFPPQACPEFKAVFEKKIPTSPLVPGAGVRFEIESSIRRIIELFDSGTAYGDIALRGYLTAVLGELFADMSFKDRQRLNTDAVKLILEYCGQNYAGPISLETVSRGLHISRHYISHLFSDKLHMKFTDYIGMLRVSEAVRLVREDAATLTEIAYQVGFNSIRSFDRVFLKHVGMTPRDYRQLARRGE